MGILSVIVGVLLLIGGFACIFTPFATFLSAGYILGILLLVFGIVGIIRCIGRKADALEWILNILSIIVGILAIARPGGTLVIDGLILTLVSIWFLVEGVVQIVLAIKTRGENSAWVFGLIAGILGLIIGIFAFVNPMVGMVTIGILIGFFFIQAGFSLIALGTAVGSEEE